MIRKILILIIAIFAMPTLVMADYPNTSIGVIDINRILSDADAAISAAEQIEEIATEIENEIKLSDKKNYCKISNNWCNGIQIFIRPGLCFSKK